MFIDFTLADQLINHAAKLHYMSGGQLKIPLTIRVQWVSAAMGAIHEFRIMAGPRSGLESRHAGKSGRHERFAQVNDSRR
jgi:hypothetical protein